MEAPVLAKTDAAILHREAQGCRAVIRAFELHSDCDFALVSELHRVSQQIKQNLADSAGITPQQPGESAVPTGRSGPALSRWP